MAFDLDEISKAAHRHGRVARVVIASVKGSAPREVGASMLVWNGGQSGTIGGGTLEFELAKRALSTEHNNLSRHALGPEMGQCCGGAVEVITEVFDANSLPMPEYDLIARCLNGPKEMPLSVKRILANTRNGANVSELQIADGWIIEPLAKPNREIWIWGAGHVGRALVNTLSPLPSCAITWIDTSEERFPNAVPNSVSKLIGKHPSALVRYAPSHAEHLILTYSHAIDLELCHALLTHSFQFAGLIGSKSKWARFQSKLATLGHGRDQISRITCPIGDPILGKHPQAIAIGVASQLLINTHADRQPQRTIA